MSDLTDQQRDAAETTGPVLVLAGAGTGKTNTLTAAAIHRIRFYPVAGRRGLVSLRGATEIINQLLKAHHGNCGLWVGPLSVISPFMRRP